MQDLFTIPSYKEALARFASGVTVVITEDANGPVGFTASSFCSLSVDPPLILVCLARSADCFPVFETAPAFTVSFLAADQQDLAMRFATRGAAKFADLGELRGAATRLPLIQDATVNLECLNFAQYEGGDHIILVGQVIQAAANDAKPLLYLNRRFGSFDSNDP